MEVVITDVTSASLPAVLPTLVAAVDEASFIALDAELSGIGLRRDLMAPTIDERYTKIAHVSQSSCVLLLSN
jgi:target of EGR1 protein 1